LAKLYEEEIVIDVSRMKFIHENNMNAVPQLVGQDVIMFIGNTGNGKSTTIHFLTGAKMVEVMFGKITHI